MEPIIYYEGENLIVGGTLPRMYTSQSDGRIFVRSVINTPHVVVYVETGV